MTLSAEPLSKPTRRFRPRLRAHELGLLALAGAITVAASGAYTLELRQSVSVDSLQPAIVLVAAFFALHVSLVLRGSRSDSVILPSILVLMGLGLVMSRRLAPDLADRQYLWTLLGVVVLALVFHVRFPLRWLRRYRYTWAIMGIGLVALTLVFGRALGSDAPRLWLAFGTLRFQPSEVLKLLVVVYLAGYLTDRRDTLGHAVTRLGPLKLPPLPSLAPLGIMLGGALLLLVAQRDLGAALLLFCIGLGMLYLASGHAFYVVGGLIAFAAGAYVLQLPAVVDAVPALEVFRGRTEIWLDPWRHADLGYQPRQALMAMGAGGVTGTGIGFGQPTAIPAVHTDFVYAAIVEELGLAGALAVLAVYGALFWRGLRVAVRAGTVFPVFLTGGLVMALALQTFVIVGGILRLIPMTGITLPFLSHGGTSLVTSALAMGLVLRISDESR